MRLIDADSAQPGLTIVAGRQSEGKGQRGKKWEDMPAQSLLMSIVVAPGIGLDRQFSFNALVSVSITRVLLSIYENWDVRIKWPNDIIINDKKAGGILIENVIRGSKWMYAVVGLGLNVLQEYFPRYLPYATSLRHASGQEFEISKLIKLIRVEILTNLNGGMTGETAMEAYNELLYRKDCNQAFTDGERDWEAQVKKVNMQGQLEVISPEGEAVAYTHGVVHWKW